MMSKHTYYGIGGPAEAFIVPKDKDDFSKILCYAHRHEIPAYFIGSGSNLLISDKGIKGLVLSPKKDLKNFNLTNLHYMLNQE